MNRDRAVAKMLKALGWVFCGLAILALPVGGYAGWRAGDRATKHYEQVYNRQWHPSMVTVIRLGSIAGTKEQPIQEATLGYSRWDGKSASAKRLIAWGKHVGTQLPAYVSAKGELRVKGSDNLQLPSRPAVVIGRLLGDLIAGFAALVIAAMISMSLLDRAKNKQAAHLELLQDAA